VALAGLVDKMEYVSLSEFEDTLSEARNIADGRVEVDKALLKRFDETILPSLSALKEKAEKEKKKSEKLKENDVLTELKMRIDDAAGNPRMAGKIKLVSGVFPSADMGVLRKAVFYAQKMAPDSVVFLGGSVGQKAFVVCAVPDSVSCKTLSAREIVCCASSEIEGSGGGKDDFAQAGGKVPEGLEKAVEKAIKFIEMKQEG
jgi:alanyl-tRNA synthetase